MNAKRTRIVILGRNVKKENAFVKETQQEMGNTAEVITTSDGFNVLQTK